jgi:hypothetical protein
MGLPLFSPDSAMVIDGGGLSWESLSLELSFNKKFEDDFENHRGIVVL